MPILTQSSYPRPPFYQFNGHLQTVLPALTRRIHLPYERERLELPDGDFLDLDWIRQGKRRLAILSHGLEGNSERHYIKGTARLFARNGWDVLAWNCRSCSGEMNRRLRLYHHGDTGDIGTVVDHALRARNYSEVTMIGFSMGGSMTLKYLGLKGKNIPPAVRSAVAISTPCDLKASAEALEFPGNRFYRQRFLSNLRQKMERKAEQFPGEVNLEALDQISVWRDFDEAFSAPLNGFANAEEFYRQGSAKFFLSDICVPVLLINAVNDPILPPACSPVELARRHPFIYLEMPQKGGHVGFSLPFSRYAWSEWRALEFATQNR